MKMNKKFYSLWLTIIVTSPINLSMIFSSIKSMLNQIYKSFNKEFQKNQKIKNNNARPKRVESDTKEKTQYEKIMNKNSIYVAFVDDNAYWVYQNTFYVGKHKNGYIDKETAQPIDAHKLSKKEFSDLLSILDSIVK